MPLKIWRWISDLDIYEIEEITTTEGEVRYEAEWRDGENEDEIFVAPDGKLLGSEVEKWEAEEDEEEQE